MSNSLQPRWLQHTRLPRSSLSPGVCSNSCPLSGWCHTTISSSVTLLSSYTQSFQASGSFSMSWLFTSDGQSIWTSGGSKVKASACSAGDPGSISGSGRSSGEGNGYPLQYSCLGEFHGLQHTRLPRSSLSPGVCSNSRPLSQWCHPTISFSVIAFSSCLQHKECLQYGIHNRF